MKRARLHQFTKVIDNNYLSSKDSIMLPTNVDNIVAICPTIQNGTGIISIYNEKTNDELLNQVLISDDNQNWEQKNIPILNFPKECNLFYVLRLIQTDNTRRCVLKISITYIGE